MKKISNDDVIHIGQLARLEIFPNEVEEYKEHMRKILSYMEELQSVSTQDIAPFFSLLREYPEMFSESFLREDEALESLSAAELLKNAPAKKGLEIMVNAVIEENA